MPLPAVLGAFTIGVFLTGLRALVMNILLWLILFLPKIIGNLLVGLGIYYVVARPVTTGILQYAMSKFAGMPSQVLSTLYYVNADDYVAIIVSAYTSLAAFNAGRAVMKIRRPN